MQKVKDIIKEIWANHKQLAALLLVSIVLCIALFIFSAVSLDSTASVTKIGYGDIGRYQGGTWNSMANSGGYRDGAWTEMFTFVFLSLIYGVLHTLLSLKIFKARGDGLAKFFTIFTIFLTLATFVVEIRLLGEG